jgi:hypothetical protein
MNDLEFRAFLNLLMCSDPWPTDALEQTLMIDVADRLAYDRGYTDWITAYHSLDAA